MSKTELIRLYVQFSFWTILFGILVRVLCLAFSDYPRQRNGISRGVDAFTILIGIGCAWALWWALWT